MAMPYIISREEWRARKPKFVKKIIRGRYVMTTWTNTDECEGFDECSKRLQQIQDKHMDEDGLPDIKYNFIINSDSDIYEGRGWKSATKISTLENCKDLKHRNRRTILIAYVGPKGSKASIEMRLTALTLAHYGTEEGYLSKNVDLFEEGEDPEFEFSEEQMSKMRSSFKF